MQPLKAVPKGIGAVGRALAFLGLSVFVLGPFAWLVISSFETRLQLFSRPPMLFPFPPFLGNYLETLSDPSLLLSLRNSLIVATCTTVAALLLGSLGAYAFARLKVPGKEPLFLAILSTQMLPGIVLLIPLYIIMRTLGLLYTYQGLILASLCFTLPYVIWLLRAFFISIPPDIEDAARVDGCSRLGAVFRVVIPLSAPGFVSTGILAFIAGWNEFLTASVMTNNATKTFTVRMAMYIGEETTSYEHMFAAAVIGTIPVLLLVIAFQRYIVRGMTEGGVSF
jgi:multiple sugar transport system permease protein